MGWRQLSGVGERQSGHGRLSLPGRGRAGCIPPELALGQFLVCPEVRAEVTAFSQAEGKHLTPWHPCTPAPWNPTAQYPNTLAL